MSTSTGAVLASDPDAAGWAPFDATGEHLYYVANGALKQVTLTTTPPTTTVLAPSGISAVWNVDPQGQVLFDSEPAPGDAGAGSAAIYVRAIAPGGPATLMTTATLNIDTGFTTEGSYALMHDETSSLLWSLAKGAASPSQLATGISSFSRLHGTKVLALGTAGASVLDPSGASPRWSINASIAIAAPSGADIVYAVEPSGGFTSIYAIPVP